MSQESDRCREQAPHPPGRRRCGFTLAEVLVVCGLIAMLTSLLLPVIGKARSAANATRCLSNLRQMGTGWGIYTSASRGHLMGHSWRFPAVPDLAWHIYWPGLLEQYGVRGDVLVCPTASDVVPDAATDGYGTAALSWSGRHTSNGNAIRLSAGTYRDGSYGMNRYLTAGNGFGEDGLATKISGVRYTSEVPLFMDCAWLDTTPVNGSETSPAAPPPNLRGDHITSTTPEHWNFLLARHGRAINVCFADGSVRRVALDETYKMRWNSRWVRYRIPLPGS
jgi:prepilin-type processing-associated H-X9-DG protein